MGDFLYSVLHFVGYGHRLHPVITHLIIGPIIAALIFQIVALVFNKPGFFKTARQMTVLGFIFWFPTVLVGVIDWQTYYGSATNMLTINMKAIGAGFIFVFLLLSIILFKKVKENSPLLLILYALSAGGVGMVGYFGGDLVEAGATAPKTETVEAKLDPADGFKTVDYEGYLVKWKIDGANIAVKVAAKTDGWLGIGFGSSGKMKDSHIILGYVKGDKPVVEDHFGNAAQKHAEKKTLQRIDTLLTRDATHVDGLTTISFTMPLKSNDPQDPVLVAGAPISIIVAKSAKADDVSYHGNEKDGGHHSFKVTL